MVTKKITHGEYTTINNATFLIKAVIRLLDYFLRDSDVNRDHGDNQENTLQNNTIRCSTLKISRTAK